MTDYLNASALAIGYFMLSIPAIRLLYWYFKTIYYLIYEAFVPIRDRKRIKNKLIKAT